MTATFTGSLTDSLAPFLTGDTDPFGDHLQNLTALGTMFEQVYGIVMDQGDPDSSSWTPGYEILLDVDACPFQFLPYLAQFVGVRIPQGASDPEARAIIRAEQGQHRGTLAAMTAAGIRNLTGTQTLLFRERTAASGSPDAYHIVVVYRPAECPDVNAFIAAIEAQKPGGIQITYVSSAGFPFNTAIHTFSADTFSFIASDTTQP